MITRDNVLLTWTMALAAVAAIAAHLELFPWIPLKYQHGLELAGFLISAVSAKMGWSWLPASQQISQQHLADTIGAASGLPPTPVTLEATQTKTTIVESAPTVLPVTKKPETP